MCELEILVVERIFVHDDGSAFAQNLHVGNQRRGIHRDENVARVAGCENIAAAEADLKSANAVFGARGSANLCGVIGQRAQVVAEHGRGVGELRAGQLHTVARVTRKAYCYIFQGFNWSFHTSTQNGEKNVRTKKRSNLPAQWEFDRCICQTVHNSNNHCKQGRLFGEEKQASDSQTLIRIIPSSARGTKKQRMQMYVAGAYLRKPERPCSLGRDNFAPSFVKCRPTGGFAASTLHCRWPFTVTAIAFSSVQRRRIQGGTDKRQMHAPSHPTAWNTTQASSPHAPTSRLPDRGYHTVSMT